MAKRVKRKPKKTTAELAAELGFYKHSQNEQNRNTSGWFYENPVTGEEGHLKRFTIQEAADIHMRLSQEIGNKLCSLRREIQLLEEQHAGVQFFRGRLCELQKNRK